LPRLDCVAGVLIPLTNNLVQVTKRNLCHKRLLDGTTKQGLDSSVASHLLTSMVENSHNCVLVPPLWFLNTVDLTTHNNNLTSGDEFSASVGRAKVRWNSRNGNVSFKCGSQSLDHLVALSICKSSRRSGGQDKVAVQINNESIAWGCE
jgi:hypothetical protein